MYTENSIVFIAVIVFLVQGVIFGVAVNTIIANKGYHENWFWGGFFFGIIALIVAAARPPKPYEPLRESPLLKRSYGQNGMDSDSWKCAFCNSINANNVTTCSCGKSREDSQQKRKDAQKATRPVTEQKDISKMVQKEAYIIKIIAQYKKLLDAGAITQEEFDKKKQSLLHK